jgi:hypothetical protein
MQQTNGTPQQQPGCALPPIAEVLEKNYETQLGNTPKSQIQKATPNKTRFRGCAPHP